MIDVSPDLLAFLKEEEGRSRNEELLETAEAALNSYNGNLYGDEEDGRSQVVTRDVAESVDPMTISILRTCVSGDRVVEFEPTAEGEEQDADDATEWMHRQFQRKRYRLLLDWIKAGLLETVAFVKTTVQTKRRRAEYVVPSVALPENAVEAEPTGEYDEDGDELWRVIMLEEGEPQFLDFYVPLEQMRVSPDTGPDLDDSPYIAHATEKSLSELIEMGFELADIEDLRGEDGLNTSLAAARDQRRLSFPADRPGVLRKVVLFEEYVRFDLDGDGIAERLCIHRVADTILSVEVVDYQPFAHWCPYPTPGALIGQSFADKAHDIQRVNTVLERLALDGLYYNLAPGTFVDEESLGDSTIDDLLNWRPNRIVRWKGNIPPMPEAKNDVSAIAFQAIEFKIKQRESRTGISRFNQGLDADALNDTATGAKLMNEAGAQVEEFLARNFVCGLADLMAIKLKLASRFGKPAKMRVDGQFREVDPSRWNDGMEIVARVGLGSGRKDQRLAYRMQLLDIQERVMGAKLPIVTPEHIFKSVSGLVKDAGLGSPSDFVTDPSTIQPQPPKPSPEEQKLQAEMQLQGARLQGEQQIQSAKIEAMKEEAALKAQLARDEATAAAELAAAKADAELSLAREKFEFEKQLSVEKLAFEERRSQRDADRRDYETDAKVSANRPGGKLDE